MVLNNSFLISSIESLIPRLAASANIRAITPVITGAAMLVPEETLASDFIREWAAATDWPGALISGL
ncbi:hypothetical protein PAEAM_28850 [Paenibacillus sp. GM1FR]|nr:hypothetical protein PAEAM_28850 [Paenibacillus sp. GM1FR]